MTEVRLQCPRVVAPLAIDQQSCPLGGCPCLWRRIPFDMDERAEGTAPALAPVSRAQEACGTTRVKPIRNNPKETVNQQCCSCVDRHAVIPEVSGRADALRPARVGRQNRRRKADALRPFIDTVAHARTAHGKPDRCRHANYREDVGRKLAACALGATRMRCRVPRALAAAPAAWYALKSLSAR